MTEPSNRDLPTLSELVATVCDEATFVAFLAALRCDFVSERGIEKPTPSNPYGSGALGWENVAFDDVLESAIRWARDTIHFTPTNPWQRCAMILFPGKFYE